MGKTRILFVTGCVALLTACGTIPRPHDGGLRQRGKLNYKHVITHREAIGMNKAGIPLGTRETGPKTISIVIDGAEYRFMRMATANELPAYWFLKEIWDIIDDPANGIPDPEKTAIVLGLTQRAESLHHLHTADESWSRIRLSYLHALDKDWYECAQKLVEFPDGDKPAGWPDYTPTHELPSDVTIEHLLWGGHPVYDKGILELLKLANHTQEDIEKVELALEVAQAKQFPGHGAENTRAARIVLLVQA